jgi:hypothetical protein
VEQLVQAGELTPAQGKKLLGHLVLDSMGIELGSRTTRWRDRKLARAGGLILADGVLQEGQEVDLSGELDEVFDTAFTGAP